MSDLKTQVMVLGGTGMLGKYVRAQFREDDTNYRVINPPRDHAFKSLFDIMEGRMVCRYPDVIINCAGAIPERNPSRNDSIKVNTMLAKVGAHVADLLGIPFIQISPSTIFSGKKGSYTVKDEPDNDTIYAVSKTRGESETACIIRTCLIGHAPHGKGMLEQFLGHESGSQIQGYTNRTWNGMTALELAKIIKEMVDNNNYWKGVKHICTTPISEYDLLVMLNAVYGKKHEIQKVIGTETLDRSLQGEPCHIALIDQLLEQRDYVFPTEIN